jgi:Methylene-tetrahydrofolate reductase C terminal
VTRARLDRRPAASATPATGLHRPLLAVERWTKETLWDCRMCGQCILHSTGLTCPMRCPKNLRNGPCGGTLQDGHCEVVPEMKCVWVEAWERSRRLPLWREHIEHVERPTDWRLQETSSWENLLSGRDRMVPDGWAADERPDAS